MEAKYPALLFKQQLDALVQKVFPMVRDNVKKQISPLLANCIITPKGHAAARRGAGGAGADAGERRLLWAGARAASLCCALGGVCGAHANDVRLVRAPWCWRRRARAGGAHAGLERHPGVL